ncbi:helix-turn-helix transcriptional regulator [Lentzea sp.]|uniref:helix-turn-helix transcriptional regulator n=1 Tax=Lentzea sp. TaxID=56099 RepID=UPI002BF4B391|nr:helix-turn-helix transcriptional regulator [Lentzea sp.]HUQ54848.1 helix-turn-helix transcriptional regulator [Lentzea sp.]
MPSDARGHPVIDITVPYHHDRANDLLADQWRAQAGDLVPFPPLTLPRLGRESYSVRIRQVAVLDLAIEDQYTDAVLGRTGGENGHIADRVVTHFTLRGSWRFRTEREDLAAPSGRVCVRRNDLPWNFEVEHGTCAVMLSLPIQDLQLPARAASINADMSSPAARLLLAHVRTCLELGGSDAATTRSATIELFQGLVNDQVSDDPRLHSALVRTAKGLIETRLLVDPDLSPNTIAAALNVSPRTLHRAFSGERMSVMGYVRERRLERAKSELTSTSWTISEIAARWNFADSSHFTKAFKRTFGVSPTRHVAFRAEPRETGPIGDAV